MRRLPGLFTEQGYVDRAKQEHQDLISLIGTVRDKFNINLIWFGPGKEVIDYLNNGQPRDQVKIAGFRIFRAFESRVFHVRLQQQHRQRV